MLAQYMAVDDIILKNIINLDVDNAIEMIEELSENETCDICDVDEMWDALHFFLTKKSAFNSVKDSNLSMAILGKEKITKNSSFREILRYIKFDDLHEIIKTLEDVDLNKLINNQDLEEYENAKIYPNRWKKAIFEDVIDELVFYFEGLLDFYKRCYNKKLNIIISIY